MGSIDKSEVINPAITNSQNSFKESFNEWIPIDQLKVANTAMVIGAYFDFPKEVINRVKKTKAYHLQDEQYSNLVIAYAIEKRLITSEKDLLSSEQKAVLEAMGYNPKKVLEKRQQNIDIIEKHSSQNAGIYFKGDILIKQSSSINFDTILQHEMIHAFTWNAKNNNDGFQTEEGKYHYLNEGVTQVLQLAFQYQIPPKELLNKIINNSISTPYRTQVQLILLALSSAEQAGKPMSYKELAQYLLKGDATIFMMDLLGRGVDEVKDRIIDKFQFTFGI